MLSIQTFENPGVASGDGIFIPLASLPGVLSSDLNEVISLEERTSKITLAMLEQSLSYLSDPSNPKLGFSASKGNPAGSGINRITQNFIFTSLVLANIKTRVVTSLPTPVSGLGRFSFADIFPGSLKVADLDPVDAGITIGVDRLLVLNNLTVGDLNITGVSDNRNLFDAILFHLTKDRELRSATVPSAVINSSLSGFAASAIPPTFTAVNSGIDFTQIDSLTILQRSYSLTLELELNQTTQTFDVRVATA